MIGQTTIWICVLALHVLQIYCGTGKDCDPGYTMNASDKTYGTIFDILEIIELIENALGARRYAQTVNMAPAQLRKNVAAIPGILGRTVPLNHVFQYAGQVASTEFAQHQILANAIKDTN